MKLTKLLERLDYKVVAGSDNIEITELVNDSRKVVPGSAFGDCGEGFVRISYAYSLENLKIAMERLSRFVSHLREWNR